MRGQSRPGRRSEFRQPTVSPPIARLKSVPAPVGGWNTRDALANMRPTDAVVMDNFYPSTGTVGLRPGRSSWATNLGTTGLVKTLIPYTSGAASKFFATTNTGIYDISTAGVNIGTSVSTSTNGKWEYRNFRNSGGTWLAMVNGTDKYTVYDGTTWKLLDGTSTPAVTGVATTDLVNIHLFKHRLWFLKTQSLSAYYLDIDAIAGALTEFPMGPIFSAGGYLIAQESWTIDGGQGIDDYLATVTSEGQLSIYQGTDPGTDFSLVGVYSVGKPLSKRCFIKYGGDILYLSKQGVFPLSKLLLSATIDRSISLSDKIDEAFRQAVLGYQNIFGWQIILHPTQNSLIINIPQLEGVTSVQFVMNNITKSWCRFTGWSMDCLGQYRDDLFCAIGGNVYKIWTGTSDAGVSIAGQCQQAYISLGQSSIVNLVRPTISLQGAVTVQTSIDTDFGLFSGISESSYITYSSGYSFWDTGTWDTAVWSDGLTPIGREWLTNTNNPGIFHSFRLQCTSSTASLTWASTDFSVTGTGLL